MTDPRKIVVLDKRPLNQDALSAVLRAAWPDVDVVAFDRPETAFATGADVWIVDLETLQEQALGLATLVKRTGAPIVLIANQAGKPLVHHAVDAGIRAVIPKTMSGRSVCDAISLVLDGGVCFPADAIPGALSAAVAAPALRRQRELEVLRELHRGSSNKVIARQLGVSVALVKLHVQSILRATQARNRTEAIVNARRMGMLPAD